MGCHRDGRAMVMCPTGSRFGPLEHATIITRIWWQLWINGGAFTHNSGHFGGPADLINSNVPVILACTFPIHGSPITNRNVNYAAGWKARSTCWLVYWNMLFSVLLWRYRDWLMEVDKCILLIYKLEKNTCPPNADQRTQPWMYK